MTERDLFIAALQTDDPAQRQAYLDEACAGRPELRRQVEGLLRLYEDAGSFLEKPAAESAATGAFRGAAEPPSSGEAPGAVIGRYKLVEQIGEGGMGTVWMAQQQEPVRRLVAVKLIKAGMDSKQVIARFEAERQALALMDHANIARVLDAGTTGAGRPYFVMDLVKGVPITRYCDEHRLAPRQRLELFVPVCQAIQHAHQKGVIHRDIKPSNILVALYDGKPVPKVIDFGVAKAAGQTLTEKTLVTGFGKIVGTLEYMSPEQAEVNQLDIDTRSDIYSLGVVLYELLAGSPPFTVRELEKAGVLEMLRVIREQEPSKPSTRLSTAEGLPTLAANRGTEPAKLTRLVRGELDWIVMKALEKDRNRRYETANGFALDVQRYLNDEPVQACPPSAGYRLGKFARRHKAALGITALAIGFVAALVGGVGWTIRDRQERQIRLIGALELALERGELFLEQGNRAEAFAALDRAREIAGQLTLDPVSVGRLESLQVRLEADALDQEFTARFEEVRLAEQSKVNVAESRFAQENAIPALREAFRRYGIQLGVTELADVVARIKGRPERVRAQLIAALDEYLTLAWQREEPPARKWLTAVLEGADRDAWRAKARKAQYAGDRPLLEKLAREVDERDQPPSFLLWVAAGLREGRPATHLAFLRRIQRAYPADFWANLSLAEALTAPGQRAEAVGYYTAALALRPQNPGVLLNRSLALREAQDPAGAVADLNQAVAVAPKYPAAHHALGLALMIRGDFAGAIAAYRRALALDPKFDRSLSSLAVALICTRDEGGAAEALRSAIALNPKFALSRYLNAVKEVWDANGAVAAARLATAVSPHSAEAHYHLGNAQWHREGDLAGASDSFRRATRLDPNYAEAHFHLGLTLREMGRFAEALASLERGRELWSKLPDRMPTATRWVEETKGCVHEEARLSALLRDGEAISPEDRIKFMAWCSWKQRFAALAGLAVQTEKMRGPFYWTETGTRFLWARAALLAADGRGEDAAGLPEERRAGWRQQALAWLRADLAEFVGRQRASNFPRVRMQDARGVSTWRTHVDLASVREREALAKLPPAEREAWRRFWEEVAAYLDKARGQL
ncbi:MAG: protein kinase [Gemmataceae bacterium]